ncbi:MAG: hypothetical protein BGO07_00945 [Alphaproteobacteria bacterium 40-19]|nr:MAG: hypothetical protein BGO07_00945 [Alphaproteobacteria bacterium 40-19]
MIFSSCFFISSFKFFSGLSLGHEIRSCEKPFGSVCLFFLKFLRFFFFSLLELLAHNASHIIMETSKK